MGAILAVAKLNIREKERAKYKMMGNKVYQGTL